MYFCMVLSSTTVQRSSKLVRGFQHKKKCPEVAYGFTWQKDTGSFSEGLEQAFPAIHQLDSISLNINIDGLPLYKSSKDEFWPILFNIQEAPTLQSMVIGIYCGKGKPSDANLFLNRFVVEMEDVLKKGVEINGHTISVSIRCFICDSPARAFIKGIM